MGVETHHYVYILKCADNTLYTGYTTNLKRRLRQHNHGIASKYTRSRLPVKMVYVEEAENRSEGLKRESAIKKLRRIEKIRLIKKGGNFIEVEGHS